MEQPKSFITHILIIGFMAFWLLLPMLMLAATPPAVLTYPAAGITQRSALLNGELTNLGDANIVAVWFDYGQNQNYGVKSSEQNFQTIGTFHIDINSLTACSVYHFRAAGRNGSNIVYGEDRTFTTNCSSALVDIQANSSNGPLTVDYGQSVNLTWTSSNVDSCAASGDWSGNRPISGSFLVGNLTSSKNFALTCSGSGGSASDNVTVNVSSQPSLAVSLEAIPPAGASPLNNVDLRALVSGAATGEVRYQFDCQNDGSWEKDITVSQQPSSPYIAQNLCAYSSPGTYTARVKTTRQRLVAENTTLITVNQYSSNIRPTVDAGLDRQVYEGETVTLQGSGSDPDGGSVSYSWTCNGGSLSNYNVSQPVFTAPQVSGSAYYSCTLNVLDDEGLTNSDSMNISVQDRSTIPEVETRQITNIQPYQATLNGYLRNLGGASSARVWFQWGYNSAYGNTTSIQYLSNQNYFNYNLGSLTQNTPYYYRAVAQSDYGTAYGQNIIFNTSGGGQSSANNYPFANAGADKQIYENETVVLQGSGSDPDGNPISYSWTCNGGNLSDYNIAQPIFRAPSFSNSINNRYTCTLTVRDNVGLSNYDDVYITILSSNKSVGQYSLRISNTAKNLSRNDVSFSKNVLASPGEDIMFSIAIESIGGAIAPNVYVNNSLPKDIIYIGDLRINDVADSRSLGIQAISLGDFPAGATKTITFRARIQPENYFNYGSVNLINTALIFNTQVSASDTCTVNVNKKGVAGATAYVSTGITDEIFHSFLLPLLLSLLLVWALKSPIVGFDRWLEKRKKGVDEYRANKKLRQLTAKLKHKI